MRAGSIRRSIYKWAWDTRCRNVDVERILRPFIHDDTTILDAGCGEYGFSAFVSAKHIVGVDVVPTDARTDGFTFICGSIISLPFSERSFSVATSIDVLEHLPATLRPDAIKQLVKVADRWIVVTFPRGKRARQIDEDFNQKLTDTNQPIPDWLAEHLQNKYPETADVVAEIEKEAARLDRKVRISVFFSEHLAIAKYLRWSAARSRYLYLIGNLATGLLLPFLPRAKDDSAYRSIVFAEFEND